MMMESKKTHDRRAYAKRQNEAVIIDCLAGLMGNLRVSHDELKSKTECAAIKPIAFATWLQLSKINLAMTVHALTKLNPLELDRLHDMDHVAMDQMIEIFLRKCIQEIQALEKHDMVAYLRKIRPHLVQD
ncbi:hypothetical protein CVIRNUC_003391 [Coccomyxa viridis]|uniref:Uncharacterized protein n=1 Tax=Coccomyxa viridis TaxID=1274662 RepID=A0AAV1I018_9CHLO|nr:hypothetical protein CVIRNUC_003391 [Coccomyxa viridis]